MYVFGNCFNRLRAHTEYVALICQINTFVGDYKKLFNIFPP